MSAPERIELDGGLVLRRWRQADAEAFTLAILESLEHLRPWGTWVDRVTVEERRAKIETWERQWAEGSDLQYGLFDGSMVVGALGLHRGRVPGELEMGYWIHAAHTRKGHATAAAAALTSVALSLPGITAVEIHHDRDNVASEGVPRKLGFTLVGEEPKRSQVEPGECGVGRIWRMRPQNWHPPVSSALPT